MAVDERGALNVPAALIQLGSTAMSALQPSPIKPAWILEGRPEARALTLTMAEDGLLSCALWDCTAGRFNWFFGTDEIVHILGGEVHIEEAGGRYTLKAGDVAFFPRGSTSIWTVPQYVKKFAIHRAIRYTLVQKVRGRVKRMLGR